jgi:O-antigen/teichoic acid export membrane protein
VTAQAQALTADAAVHASRRPVRFDSTLLLSGAMALSGVLTYAFQILAARRLGAGSFGQIAVLWGAMFLLAIVFFRPLEQTLSRSIANRLAQGQEIGSVLRSIGVVSGGIAVGGAVASVVAWTPVTNGLFHGDSFMTAMLVAGVAGYGASYLVRGVLGGVRWFKGYAVVLLADAIGRLAFAAPLVLVSSRHLAAVAVAAAGMAGAVAPFLWARHWLPALRGGGSGAVFDSRGALRFAGPASVVAAVDQLLINGAPLLVILLGSGGTREAGVVFAATMLVRAPVYVFTGVAASLLPNFTLLGGADHRELAAVLKRTVRILAVAGVVIVVGVAAFGPTSMGILYGDGFASTRLDLVLLGASVALYLASATFLQALLALDRGASGAVAWLMAAVALVVTYLVLPWNEVERVSVALVVATATNALLHGLLLEKILRSRERNDA